MLDVKYVLECLEIDGKFGLDTVSLDVMMKI